MGGADIDTALTIDLGSQNFFPGTGAVLDFSFFNALIGMNGIQGSGRFTVDDGDEEDFDLVNPTISVRGPSNTVPEPSTMLLFGSGLAGIVAWRFKKQHAKS